MKTKPRIITLTGDLGAGKGATCEMLCSALNYEYYGTGNIFRQLAKERNLSVYELNKLAMEDDSIDKLIDANLEKYLNTHENIVVDSRMASYFKKDAFNVYLKVDIDESVRRIMNSGRLEEKYNTVEEAKKIIMARQEEEAKRYKLIYNIDRTDLSTFDLVIDTTCISVEEVTNKVIEEYRNWLEGAEQI